MSSRVTFSVIFIFFEGSIGILNVSFLKTHNSSSHEEYTISTLSNSKSRLFKSIILLKLASLIKYGRSISKTLSYPTIGSLSLNFSFSIELYSEFKKINSVALPSIGEY